ncbi:MAG: orotate phosphoribosyltransferase [Firmicutes bacterium]|nr:orotate phosphoribosyltransferase [Bacillota bacterium]
MKTKAARALLQTGAVFFRPEEPFTWASGIKSPVYTDNRLVLTDPQARRVIEEGLIELIRETYPEAQALFGTATAGIPHAAIAGYAMDLPMGYVRSGAKDHGRANRIEGRVEPGSKAVVIEDLISTGGSVISAAQALQEAGAEVLGVICIFSYNLEKSRTAFAQAKLEYHSLTDFDTVAKAAAEDGYISAGDIAQLMEFRNSL